MLFDGKLFDGDVFDGGGTLAVSYSTDLAVFDDFSLSDGVNMVITDFPEPTPSRDIIGGDIPRDHGEYYTADYWRRKTITLTGYVKASTAALLDAYLDTIKKNLRRANQSLDITRNGTARRYVATWDQTQEIFAGREGYHTTICPFTMTFLCKTPFSKDRDYASHSSSMTTSPTTESVYNSGSFEAKPVITINFTSATSVTTANVKRIDSSGTTLDEIEVTGTFAAGDVIVFNSETKTVTHNGSASDFTGSFPILDVETNLMKFTINGTFDCYNTISFLPTYL